ncbi:MAG: helix-turn-helix domain-containing protein [Deltaproteobacteria bacterium]|jgi:transposase-like protein|nr:helix-turn-helix domain-containing protein [Deltaproteobacteria bacterium]
MSEKTTNPTPPRSEEDLALLRKWAAGEDVPPLITCRSDTPPPRDDLIQRAKAVALSLDGNTLGQAASKSGLHRSTVRKWRKVFSELGPYGLLDARRSGRAIDDGALADREKILALAKTPPPDGAPRWSAGLLARELGITEYQARAALYSDARDRAVELLKTPPPPGKDTWRPATAAEALGISMYAAKFLFSELRPGGAPRGISPPSSEADMALLKAWAAGEPPPHPKFPDPLLPRRAKTILMLIEGRTGASISSELGMDVSNIAKWKSRFFEMGVEGILKSDIQDTPTRHPYSKTIAALREVLSTPPPAGARAWTAAAAARKLGMGASRIRSIMNSEGLLAKRHVASGPNRLPNSPDDLDQLKIWSAGDDPSPDAPPAWRAQVVLKSLEGIPDTVISRELKADRTKIGKWRRRYAEGGPDALRNKIANQKRRKDETA